MENRTVLTIATGKPVYRQMAVHLARSFFWWNEGNGIRFRLVTDDATAIPADVGRKAEIIAIKPGEYGESFVTKLSLDKFAADGQTLFIDADCLVFCDLAPVFDRFRGRAVSVCGGYISDGEWFGDVTAIRQRFGLSRYPKFNGGVYYLENGKTASQVYQTARELAATYDEIGFVRLRNRPNDEVVMALALALHEQEPVPDDGTVLSDFLSCPGPSRLNVISGLRELTNPPTGHRLHQAWYPLRTVHPAVVHFLGAHAQYEPYLTEINRLDRVVTGRQSPAVASAMSRLTVSMPLKIKNRVKNILRAPFRLLFGTRGIKRSPRT